VISYADLLYFGFTSRYDSSNIQRSFYQILESLGAEVNHIEPDYPEDAKPNYEGRKFMKSFTYCCIVAAVLGAMINAIFMPDRHWTLLVSAGILTMWFELAVGYKKRHNLMKNAMWQLCVVPVGCILWDIFTGWRAWSVNFVMPCMTILVLIAMLIISRIQSHSAREYMIYYVMASVYGTVIPLILLLTNIITFTTPAILCIGFSFLFLVALILFKGREFREEIYKKLHI
ncbi:MAG: DUF6320 domain-containing protein, partial [Dorea sp.]